MIARVQKVVFKSSNIAFEHCVSRSLGDSIVWKHLSVELPFDRHQSLQEAINTITAFYIFAALAEFEHNLIQEQTNEGLMAARGWVGGRLKALDPNKQKLAVKLYNDRQYSIAEICQIIGVSKPTLYKYIDQNNDK